MSDILSRRRFIGDSVIGASAAVLGSTSVAKGFPANDRVRLAWIGIGGRGIRLIQTTLEKCPDAQIAAVCNLKPDRIAENQNWLSGINRGDTPTTGKCWRRKSWTVSWWRPNPARMSIWSFPS